MQALTFVDLNNGKVDLDHIAAVATSKQPTAADRMGRLKLTLQGAVDTIKTINPRGEWVAATAYKIKDVVFVSGVAGAPGTWYIAVVEHISAGVFAADAGTKWRVHQGVTVAEMAEPDTAARLGLAGEDVIDYLKAFRSMASFGEAQRQMLSMTPILRPNQTFMDAIMRGKVTIVVAADSISEGADTHYVNGWVSNFSQMLSSQIPWIEWNVINLSLGGRGLRDLQDPAFVSPDSFTRPAKTGGIDSQSWPDGALIAGKAWRDYVRDAAPDLFVMAHQENMGEDTSFMQANWNSFRFYSESWPKAPWFCFVATHLPTDRSDLVGGEFAAQQIGRQGIADWIRATALEKGYGLIDNNALFRMLRDGKRVETVPFTVERNFRYFGDPAHWNSAGGLAPVLSDGVMTFPSAGLARRIGTLSRDVDISGDYSLNAGSVVNVSYRTYKTFKSYVVQYGISPGRIQLYCGGTELSAITISAPTNPCNIRVKVTGSRHEIYYNGKRVLKVIDGTISTAGVTSIGFVNGLGSGGTVSNLYLCLATEFDSSPQYFDEATIFGHYPPDSTSNPDTTGGDGIHHLSDKGIFLVYLTAAQGFIDDLKSIFGNPQIATSGPQSAPISSPINGAIAVVAGCSCYVTTASQKYVMAHISFSYRNPGPVSGVLQLVRNGAAVTSWYLPMTAGISPENFSASVPIILYPGTFEYGLTWGALPVGQAAMTSNDQGGRSLALIVTPA